MNSFNVMQTQARAMKLNWFTLHGSGSDSMHFQGAKKRSDEVQDMNALVANALKEVLKSNKREKYTAAHESGLEEEPENSSIGLEWDNTVKFFSLVT